MFHLLWPRQKYLQTVTCQTFVPIGRERQHEDIWKELHFIIWAVRSYWWYWPEPRTAVPARPWGWHVGHWCFLTAWDRAEKGYSVLRSCSSESWILHQQLIIFRGLHVSFKYVLFGLSRVLPKCWVYILSKREERAEITKAHFFP